MPRAAARGDSATLPARLAQHDAAALAELYRREAAPVHRYAPALCGNAVWAADATQEAFVALAARPGAFDAARGPLGAYLAGVALHALAAQWRELRRCGPLPEHADGDDGSAEDPAAAAAVSPEALLARVQAGAQVWTALRLLPVAFREAIVLVDLQERAYADAARIAGIELNTLRSRLHRARQKLATPASWATSGRSRSRARSGLRPI